MSETKELKDKIKKAEGLLRTESSKVEEQTMMLEEKQRTGDAAITSAEMECRDLQQSLLAAQEDLQQSQSRKKQLLENVDKVKEELEEMEKATSNASRITPQQVGLLREPPYSEHFSFEIFPWKSAPIHFSSKNNCLSVNGQYSVVLS